MQSRVAASGRASVILVIALLTAIGLGIAAIWAAPRRADAAPRARIDAAAGVGAGLIGASTLVTPAWDTSENRANSFSEEDEGALKRISEPVRIEVHLAPEDPRRVDLDRQAIAKLRRVLPRLEVDYISATSVGLVRTDEPALW
jgi:ABC-2 type transport system permease protein